MRDEFFSRLMKAKVPITRAQFDAAQSVIDRTMEQQFAQLAFGDSTAFKRGLRNDDQLGKALDLLGKAPTQRQLLAMVGEAKKPG